MLEMAPEGGAAAALYDDEAAVPLLLLFLALSILVELEVEMALEQVPRRPLQTRLGASSPSHENGVLCPCPSRYD